MEALKLLDSYCKYHDNGTTSLQKAFWSLTKARIRNTGTQTALLYSSSTSGGVGSTSSGTSSNDQTTDSILSIMNAEDNIRSDNHKVFVQTRSMVLLGEAFHQEPTDTDEAVKIDGSKIRFKFFDPIKNNTEKEKKENSHIITKEKALESTRNDDNEVVELIDDDKEDNVNSVNKNQEEDVYDMDPTKSTGLRQRKQKQRKDYNIRVASGSTATNTTMDSDEFGNDSVAMNNPTNAHKDFAAAVEDSSTSNVILLDPFDDLGMLMINCNSSHRNEIKNAQKHAIESLQHYIHAATLVASIQHAINSNAE